MSKGASLAPQEIKMLLAVLPDACQLGVFDHAQPERHRPGGAGQAAEHLGHPAGIHHQRACGLRPDPLRRKSGALYQQLPQEYAALPPDDHQAR